MQLSPRPGAASRPTDVASGLTTALVARGPGPAITVYRPGRRDEQGVASLAQWAAKGAHLLEAELVLSPGDRIHVDVAPGWPLAAVCLAAWWSGVAVDLSAGSEGIDVAVVHEGRRRPDAADVLWTGDAVDGTPEGHDEAGGRNEAWAMAVQSWPDAPPPPQSASDAVALITGDRHWTQAELLADAAAIGTGRLGVDVADLDPVSAVLTLAARPISTPHATVLLVGTDRSVADGERVHTWYSPATRGPTR